MPRAKATHQAGVLRYLPFQFYSEQHTRVTWPASNTFTLVFSVKSYVFMYKGFNVSLQQNLRLWIHIKTLCNHCHQTHNSVFSVEHQAVRARDCSSFCSLWIFFTGRISQTKTKWSKIEKTAKSNTFQLLLEWACRPISPCRGTHHFLLFWKSQENASGKVSLPVLPLKFLVTSLIAPSPWVETSKSWRSPEFQSLIAFRLLRKVINRTEPRS